MHHPHTLSWFGCPPAARALSLSYNIVSLTYIRIAVPNFLQHYYQWANLLLVHWLGLKWVGPAPMTFDLWPLRSPATKLTFRTRLPLGDRPNHTFTPSEEDEEETQLTKIKGIGCRNKYKKQQQNSGRLIVRLLDLAVDVAGGACSVRGPASPLHMPGTELPPLCAGHL